MPFPSRGDDGAPPGTVDPLVFERLERRFDRPDLRLRQRDVVREAVHERHPAAVRDDLDDVADEQVRAAVQHGRRPRNARRSGSASSRRRGRASRPDQNRSFGSSRITHSRSASCSQHRAVEAVRPFDHRRVVVRVRDRDRVQPAARVDLALGLVVQQRDAVPEHVAVAVRRPAAPAGRSRTSARCRSRAARPRRGSAFLCPPRSSCSVVHCWPSRPTYWRGVLADRAVVALGRVLDPAGHADR